ncbi:hypothetical protein KP509_13G078100 [Ceratopteris richardii]|nr:hypothetical protein KP509_13G078100 [Ceratopteris richardii]
MYSKCGFIHDARSVFNSLSCHNVVSWTAMISGYARCLDTADEALVLFQRLLLDVWVIPNEFTFLSVFNACSNLGRLEFGRMVHIFMTESGIESGIGPESFVGTALINMYSKCDDIEDAQRVFESMSYTEAATWTILINGYAKQGLADEALQLFKQMQCQGLSPDNVAFAGVLVVCASSACLNEGRRVHATLTSHRLNSNPVIESALLDMYCKCGSIGDAVELFNRLEMKSLVPGNTMLSGYVNYGMLEDAFKLYSRMVDCSNHVTFVTILKGCVTMKDFERGQYIHMDIICQRLDCNLSVQNALIDFYVNLERLEDARRVFEKVSARDNVSWTVMIAGCIRRGHIDEANSLFSKMESDMVAPNEITFLSIITACSAVGHLEQSMEIHSKILKCGMESRLFIANALIDMYSKCGEMYSACLIFDKLLCQDIIAWNAIISGCAFHGLGKESLLLIMEMQQAGITPNDVTFLGVLSACSRTGMIEEGFSIYHFMVEKQQVLPTADHLVCIVDLLARVGHVEAAETIIRSLPLHIPVVVWRALLNACRLHAYVQLAKCVIENLLSCEQQDASLFALLSNIMVTVVEDSENQ